MTKLKIEVGQIHIDDTVLGRCQVNQAVAADYEELVRLGVELPPLDVFWVQDEGKHFLVDGRHRLHVRKKAGETVVLCEMHKGTLSEARWFAAAANLKHGLRPSQADKRRAIGNLLADPSYAKTPWAQIAVQCGVTGPTVAAVAKTLGMHASDTPKSATRITSSGKVSTYELTPPSKGAAEPEDAFAEEVTTASVKSLGIAKRLKDRCGNLVPEWLEGVVRQSEALDRLCTAFGELVQQVKSVSALEAGADLATEADYIVDLLKEARQKVHACRLYEVCLDCTGSGKQKAAKACKVCGGWGWRSEREYHAGHAGKG